MGAQTLGWGAGSREHRSEKDDTPMALEGITA